MPKLGIHSELSPFPRIAPKKTAPGEFRQAWWAAPIATPSQSAVRAAKDLPGRIIKNARDVTAPRGHVVERPAIDLVLHDQGRRIRNGLGLDLCDQDSDPTRHFVSRARR